MCNLYSVVTNQQAIRAPFGVTRDNMLPLPAIFPDQIAPVVRQDGADRALAMMRWECQPLLLNTSRPSPIQAFHTGGVGQIPRIDASFQLRLSAKAKT